MLTPYPQIVEYNEAVQNPATAFRDPELRQGRVRCNALGLPVALSGGFALTYMMAAPRRALAVRCFHRDIPAAQQKYAAIARVIKTLRSEYFVDFDYLADGIRIRGGFYPVLKMDWADGDPLGVWLDRNSQDRRALQRIREAFAGLAAFLETNGIAHGDIQNGNVIISPQGLRLVDYDGVYVPGMPAEFGSETGHRHFQHPGRTPAHFGPTIDRFSFIAVDLSLAALIEDPSLHRRFRQGGETILFRANDFADPQRSEVFRLLDQRPALKQAARNFADICRADIAAVPALADFRAGRNVPPAARPESVAAAPAASENRPPPRAARYIAPYPVLRADDVAAVRGCVGQRIELVGRVREVRHGLGEHRGRPAAPCFVVDFGPARGDRVDVRVWAGGGTAAQEMPDEHWVGRWVSIAGLVDPPYRERHFWWHHERIGITTENPRDLDLISEEEARFRLRRGAGAGHFEAGLGATARSTRPTPQAETPSPHRPGTGGGNRQLVARLLTAADARRPANPMSQGSRSAPGQPRASNRDILRRLRSAPPASPMPRAASAPPASRSATPQWRPAPSSRPSSRRAMPKSGSIVIHPRSRTAPRPPPEGPGPAPEAGLMRRVLRFIGFDA